jgi:hypothetical protein
MSSGRLISGMISSGNASRYIRPTWFNNGFLSTEAFDLRVGPPPESYVSHFMTKGIGIECFASAYEIISGKIKKCHQGSIAVLNVSEALAEVNDDVDPFIKFVDKGLPHCGLIYVTKDQVQIQEAKATLRFLAQKNIMAGIEIVKSIEAYKDTV